MKQLKKIRNIKMLLFPILVALKSVYQIMFQLIAKVSECSLTQQRLVMLNRPASHGLLKEATNKGLKDQKVSNFLKKVL